jgi:hypothetical protein
MRGVLHRARAGILAAALSAACAGPLQATEAGWRHARQDYSIGTPDGPGEPWTRVDLKGAVLAFRRPGPEGMSLQSHCGRPVASAPQMARNLLIGLPAHTEVTGAPVQVSGQPGWKQRFETTQDGTPVRVVTVTVVARDCSFDFVLASSDPSGSAEEAFDAWWSSLRLGPRYAAEAPPR